MQVVVKEHKITRKEKWFQAGNEMEINQTNLSSTPIITQNAKRRHIYFTDCDEKGTVVL